jgi:hypothetical protein
LQLNPYWPHSNRQTGKDYAEDFNMEDSTITWEKHTLKALVVGAMYFGDLKY